MAKVTASVNVRGVDAGMMIAAAKRRLENLATADWKIDGVEIWDHGGLMDEVATAEGMLPMWSATVSATADVEEG